jgi:c(7)-type cytochrome triheme protein
VAAFREPFWSTTTLAFVMGMIFMVSTVALSYDGIRLRVPAPTQLSEEPGSVEVSRGLAELKMPADIAVKKGKTSPGQVTFSHARHVDKKNPNCNACHAGLFRMLPTTADISPDKKMRNCGQCHDGVKAVGILQKERCDSCHSRN